MRLARMRARVSREAPSFAEFARKPAPRPWATVMAAPAVEQPAPAARVGARRVADVVLVDVVERRGERGDEERLLVGAVLVAAQP